MNFIFYPHITKGSEGKIQGGKGNFLFFCTKNTPMTSKSKSEEDLVLPTQWGVLHFVLHMLLQCFSVRQTEILFMPNQYPSSL